MGKQVYLSDKDIKNIQIVFDYYFNSGNWIDSDKDKEEYEKRNESFENTSNKIDKLAKSK